MELINIFLAQHDFPVGDVAGNADRAIALIALAKARADAHLLVFPELTLSGYLAEDLFLRPDYIQSCHDALERIVENAHGIDVIVGHPWLENGKCYNALSWLRDGRIITRYAKQVLPNYAVFDEKRYFTPGHETKLVDFRGLKIAPLICEDLWDGEPVAKAAAAGADAFIVINASPFDPSNRARRIQLMQDSARTHGKPLFYVNLVGGQNDLIFDGGAMACDPGGNLIGPAPAFEEALYGFSWQSAAGTIAPIDWASGISDADGISMIYRAIVQATRDFVRKNGFSKVAIGLSGGVDSALTLVVACDALGADNVSAIMMPSEFTSPLSRSLAYEQAKQLGAHYAELSINAAYQAFENTLAPIFAGTPKGTTEENIQARCRAVLLMALANKQHLLVLNTSNKSELAVGYATLYGDMCGAFAPLKDCYKTLVYDLCRYRNAIFPAIPEAVIERAPTAELRANQKDQDSLPPYPMLDGILQRHIESKKSIEEIVADGYAEETVRKVIALVKRNEYKRLQAAPGPHLTANSLGRDWRMPVPESKS